MSADEGWRLDRARLEGSLSRRRAQRPDAATTKHVHEFLMDLVMDPQACGQPDDHGRRRRVFVVDISFWDG
ncbi:MAG: hypothetical protein U0V56_11875 [Actinomycetota bacterium]